MVSINDLVCATDASDAKKESKHHPSFSYIPIKGGNGLSAYYCRDTRKVDSIRVPDLISDGTGILDLVDALENRKFAFILGPRQIDGYVHYSDLNHPLVKLTFYVLLEGVERFALDSVMNKLNDDFLKKTLGEPRFRQIQQSYKRSGDAGQSIINYLNISDILKLACAAETLVIDAGLIKTVKRVRNGAAHVSENLVSDYSDVMKLAQVKAQCLRVLRNREGN
jgi:hypothetical protein